MHLEVGEAPSEPEGGAATGGKNVATKAAAKRLWERRPLCELGNRFAIPTFPQSQQQQSFGYISNVSTTPRRVTFSNVLTGRPFPNLPHSLPTGRNYKSRFKSLIASGQRWPRKGTQQSTQRCRGPGTEDSHGAETLSSLTT